MGSLQIHKWSFNDVVEKSFGIRGKSVIMGMYNEDREGC